MRIKSGQDLLTGLLFIVVGGAGLWIGADYPMGTAQRPGTGVLPYILSWCLIGTGGLLWIKAMLAEGPGLTGWAWRPIIMITLATIAGSTWAFIEFGTSWISDPRISVSFITWGIYLAMICLRVTAGWRGRKAAFMAIAALGGSAITWVTHNGLLRHLTQ